MWTAADFKARRPDGYKQVAAPLLLGELNQVCSEELDHLFGGELGGAGRGLGKAGV